MCIQFMVKQCVDPVPWLEGVVAIDSTIPHPAAAAAAVAVAMAIEWDE